MLQWTPVGRTDEISDTKQRGRPLRGGVGRGAAVTRLRVTAVLANSHAPTRVRFPDFRIEYMTDGRELHKDVEVVTPHHRGAHAAGVAPFDPRVAEQFL